MSKFVRRFLIVAIVFFVIALLIACGAYLAYRTDGHKPTAATTSTPTSDTLDAPATDMSPGEYTTEPSAPAETSNVTATAAPVQVTALNARIKKRSVAPTSGLNLGAYLNSIAKTSNVMWRDYLIGVGLQDPVVTYDITSGNDRYVSTCVRDGEAIVVTASYARTFYCSSDGRRAGQVALPTAAFTSPSPWAAGKSRATGDLSATVTVTRATSHIVIGSLREQLSLSSPGDVNRQYVAACLSGTLIYGLYPRGSMSENQIRDALELSFAVPSEVDGVVTSPPATDEQLYTSWMIGYNTGNPGECAQAFWE